MAKERSGEIVVAGRPGRWVLNGDLGQRPLLILAHGAGAPLDSPFLEFVASGLVELGLSVVRFHFPYMEAFRTDGKRRPPDRQPILLETWERMFEQVRAWKAQRGAVFVGGKSMGGRMASVWLASGRTQDVTGAVYLGYPLHPAGKPEVLRADHLERVGVRQLFVSGSKDPMCRLDLLRPILAGLGERVQLHVVEGGDHSLARSRRDPFAGGEVWLDRVARFVAENSSATR